MSAAQNISRIDLSNILKRNSIGSNAYFSDPGSPTAHREAETAKAHRG